MELNPNRCAWTGPAAKPVEQSGQKKAPRRFAASTLDFAYSLRSNSSSGYLFGLTRDCDSAPFQIAAISEAGTFSKLGRGYIRVKLTPIDFGFKLKPRVFHVRAAIREPPRRGDNSLLDGLPGKR